MNLMLRSMISTCSSTAHNSSNQKPETGLVSRFPKSLDPRQAEPLPYAAADGLGRGLRGADERWAGGDLGTSGVGGMQRAGAGDGKMFIFGRTTLEQKKLGKNILWRVFPNFVWEDF